MKAWKKHKEKVDTQLYVNQLQQMCKIPASEDIIFVKELINQQLDLFSLDQLEKMRDYIAGWGSRYGYDNSGYIYNYSNTAPPTNLKDRITVEFFHYGTGFVRKLNDRMFALNQLGLKIHPKYDQKYRCTTCNGRRISYDVEDEGDGQRRAGSEHTAAG